MSFLTLHKVKNGFLLFAGKAESWLQMEEAIVAKDAHELIAHIEAHFTPPIKTPDVVIPAGTVRNDLDAIAADLAGVPTVTETHKVAP